MRYTTINRKHYAAIRCGSAFYICLKSRKQMSDMKLQEQVNEIKNRILRTQPADWKRFAFDINTKDLKTWDTETAKEQLKDSVKRGFVNTFNVWVDEDGKSQCLDGKHRVDAFIEMEKEGISIPELLPTNFVECKDRKDAAELVLVYSSFYARITNMGLQSFLKTNEVSLEDFKGVINLPEFSMPRFEQKFQPERLPGVEDLSEPDPEISDADCIVKPGDLFEINGHRILCADCLDDEAVALLMQGKQARMFFVDPPYNLPTNFFSGKGEAKHDDFVMAAGEMSDKEFRDFLAGVMRQMANHSIDGAIHFMCMDFRHIWHVTDAGAEVYGEFQSDKHKYEPKNLCVWNKQVGANGSFYRAKHELVFVYKWGTERHKSHLDLQDRIRYNVWDYPTSTSFNNIDREELKNHPTPKPVVMVEDAIMDVTDEGDLVVDFFLGSGTTLMGAIKTKRIFYGTEIAPKYVQSIIKRALKYFSQNSLTIKFAHINGHLQANHFYE